MKYVYDSWLQHHGRYPSTGFLSVIFALHVCDEVGACNVKAQSRLQRWESLVSILFVLFCFVLNQNSFIFVSENVSGSIFVVERISSQA